VQYLWLSRGKENQSQDRKEKKESREKEITVIHGMTPQ